MEAPVGVRFDLNPQVSEQVRSCADEHEISMDGKTIRYHIVPRGNLFDYCQIAPQLMTPELCACSCTAPLRFRPAIAL
ncbi:hypothetical protein IV102_08470 [bacterium]|nr:hypothetical protein [bacterium]